MENISIVQLLVIGGAIVGLLFELFLRKKGKLVEVTYTKSQRLKIAFIVFMPFLLLAFMGGQSGPTALPFMALGLVSASIVYHRKDWHRVKKSQG